MKNARPQKAGTSAVDKRDFTASNELFPELLAPTTRGVAPSVGAISDEAPRVAPAVSGQCARVLELIRKHQPLLSFVLTADYAIPEAAARVHDLRAKGFNVVTMIVPEVVFRGVTRRNAAFYSIGFPEWGEPTKRQAGAADPGLAALVAFCAVCLVLLAGAF